jgi:hypothetical protein
MENITDDDHEERRQNLRKTKADIGHDGPELGKGAGGEEVANDLFEIVKDDAAVLDGLDDRGEGVEEHHVGGLDGNVGAAAHGDADVGRLERGRVVDAVARHGHDAVLLELLDNAQLLLGRRARKDDLLVLRQDLPLVCAHAHQVRTAEDDGLSRNRGFFIVCNILAR